MLNYDKGDERVSMEKKHIFIDLDGTLTSLKMIEGK